jgi:hypothetical protein
LERRQERGNEASAQAEAVWAACFFLDRERRIRDRALFDPAIDSKLRGCDLVKIRIRDVVAGPEIRTRAIVIQQKTGRPVQFEITSDVPASLLAWLERRGGSVEDYVFPSRVDHENRCRNNSDKLYVHFLQLFSNSRSVYRPIRDRLEITLLKRSDSEAQRIFELPWSKPSFRRRRQIIAADPGAADVGSARAISSEQQSRLLNSIADARRWLDEIAKTGIDTTAIAVRVGRSERSVRMGLSLAFLAPDIVQAILDRTLSRTIGLSRLAELPMLWADQRRELGMPAI